MVTMEESELRCRENSEFSEWKQFKGNKLHENEWVGTRRNGVQRKLLGYLETQV